MESNEEYESIRDSKPVMSFDEWEGSMILVRVLHTNVDNENEARIRMPCA